MKTFAFVLALLLSACTVQAPTPPSEPFTAETCVQTGGRSTDEYSSPFPQATTCYSVPVVPQVER